MNEENAPVWDVNQWIASDPDWQRVVRAAGGADPNIFYPVQQDPDAGIPYVRYTSTLYANASEYWWHQDEIMYALYFNNVMDSNRAMNIIFDMVSAGDLSGGALESWRREQALADPSYDSFRYHSLEWIAGGSTQPTEERGGAHARLVTFRVWYSPLQGRHMLR